MMWKFVLCKLRITYWTFKRFPLTLSLSTVNVVISETVTCVFNCSSPSHSLEGLQHGTQRISQKNTFSVSTGNDDILLQLLNVRGYTGHIQNQPKLDMIFCFHGSKPLLVAGDPVLATKSVTWISGAAGALWALVPGPCENLKDKTGLAGLLCSCRQRVARAPEGSGQKRANIMSETLKQRPQTEAKTFASSVSKSKHRAKQRRLPPAVQPTQTSNASRQPGSAIAGPWHANHHQLRD